MGGRVASSLIIFLHLFLAMFAEALVEVGEKSKQMEKNDHIEAPSVIRMVTKMEDSSQETNSHMEHTNHQLIVFFNIKDLKQGQKLPIYFPQKRSFKISSLFAQRKGRSNPIFTAKIPPKSSLFFSFPLGSSQSQAVKETLQQCELKPIKGETKFCATSMESMVDFVGTALGKKSSSFKFLTTSHLTNSHVHFQNYTISGAPEAIAAPRLVACHAMPYPYAVYYCHYQEGDNSVLKIPLEGDNGDRVQAMAVCHMDTSQWSPSHPAFRVLKTEPGADPVCHFFPADDFVWIPNPISA